jgi:hypothetical protein
MCRATRYRFKVARQSASFANGMTRPDRVNYRETLTGAAKWRDRIVTQLLEPGQQLADELCNRGSESWHA